MSRWPLAALAVLLSACGGSPPPPSTPRTPPSGATVAAPVAAAPDPLGPKPDVPTPAPFAPPTPAVYAGPNGVTVWLLERHTVPFVAVTVAIPAGSSSDPRGKGGLADASLNMMDEGAGTRGAIELSRAVDTLGATLATGATTDTSAVSLSVLKKNFAPAMAILGDVVVRPRFDAGEWKRVHDLWLGDLKERASEPREVSRVVARAALFGADHPYGHPVDGTVASAKAVTLDDVKAFYRKTWRPDRAFVVAVGDVTKEELAPLLESSFGQWKAPSEAAPTVVVPPTPQGPWPHAVLVDRPDAPQSMVVVVRPGVAAGDPSSPALWRVNEAIGGSFTSRLNQDLREEHGWSYGAGSSVAFTRGVGPITMSAAVITEKTVDALTALLADVDLFSKKGLTEEEVQKTRSQARAELVEAYEGAAAAAGRLAMDAALGLPADYEATTSLERDSATKGALDRLAATDFDASHGVVVLVGPRAKLEKPLAAAGFAQVELRDADGNVVKAR